MEPLHAFLLEQKIKAIRLSDSYSDKLKACCLSEEPGPCYQVLSYPFALFNDQRRLLVQHIALNMGYAITEDKQKQLDFIIPIPKDTNEESKNN